MKIARHLAEKNADIYGVKPVTLAFLGDSVTQGCFEVFQIGEKGLDTIYDYSSVYHTKLKKLLNNLYPAAPINIINAGISGDNITNGYSRLERDVLAFSPDLVVVCFGLNDVHKGADGLSAYETGLINIMGKLKRENIESIFMTPNMMNTNISPHITSDFIKSIAEEFAKVQNDGLMDLYIDAARKICEEVNVPVCDCYSKWKQLHKGGVNVTELLSNHLNHPKREMHDLFAQALLDCILFTNE